MSSPACLIPGFACGMLLYSNERLWPVVFAVVLSIGSKLMFRAPVGNGHTQHIFNPSNLGVGLTRGAARCARPPGPAQTPRGP